MTIAFDNSYARLPDRFFVRQQPGRSGGAGADRRERTACPKARPRPRNAGAPRLGRHLRRQCAAGRGGADRPGLCRAPVRRLGAAARRRAGAPARRDRRPGRASLRPPAQGLRPHALFAARRRAGLDRAGAARIHRLGGDGSPRRADDAGPRRRNHGRGRLARDGPSRRGARARGVEPYPRRHVPVFRRARRYRGAGDSSSIMSSPVTIPMPKPRSTCSTAWWRRRRG